MGPKSQQYEFFDEVRRTVIIAILGDDDLGERLVLKGGNLLHFAYGISYRASKDVDISIDGDLEDIPDLASVVEGCLTRAFSAMGFVLLDFKFRERPSPISEDLRGFWGGYNCEFKLLESARLEEFARSPDVMVRNARSLGEDGSTVFKIDFSRHEFCEERKPFEIDGYEIQGYSPQMFVAEKIRALCQQMPEYGVVVHRVRSTASRARDFVDVHVMVEHYGVDFSDKRFHEIVKKTFAQKRVPLNLIAKIQNTFEQHERTFSAVQEAVGSRRDLQAFEFYFNWLCKQCLLLEPLWNE